jgi:hypothetical protein
MYQVVSGPSIRLRPRRGLHPEHDAADGGDEEDDRGDLEGQRWSVRNSRPISPGCRTSDELAAVGEPAVEPS